MSSTRFERIALSLSGGGFRAAAFHLGSLRLLDRVGLLPHVRALSTASGGTIVGAYYAQCLARGISFDAFSSTLREFLVSHDVIDEALKALDDERPVRTTLITSAAGAWTTLLDGSLGELATSHDHLEELSFNATDLQHGLAFRFVKTSSHFVRSGNREAPIPPDIAAKLRLSDIVAASSCFPAAFEPMVFPSDFVLDGESKTILRPVPLMDGGIYDNLGIDSLLLVRARKARELDTIIVCDADTSAPPMYSEPPLPRFTNIRIGTLYYGTMVAGGLAVGSFLAALRDLPWSLPQLLLFACVAAGSFLVLRTVHRAAAQPIAGRSRPLLWRHLTKLTLGEFASAAAARGSSLVALTSRIFMKRVRTLTYTRVFESRRTRGRAVGNLIGDLATDATVPAPIRTFAARAASMPTTLWADSPQQIDDLIRLGELSLCRSLLHRIESGGGNEDLRARLTEEWGRLVRST